MRELSAKEMKLLLECSDATRSGRGYVVPRGQGVPQFNLKAAGLIESDGERGYRITVKGEEAIMGGQIDLPMKAHRGGRVAGMKSAPAAIEHSALVAERVSPANGHESLPRVEFSDVDADTPPVSNGSRITITPHHCDQCRYKAVLDLVAARIPEAAELLNAVEAFDKAVSK